MSGEEVTNRAPLVLATTAVATVAAVTAVVSYSHMYEVAAVAGEQWRAWILPFSVDGLLVAATLNAWRARRAGAEVAGLTVAALAVGLLVSIAANVAAPFLPPPGSAAGELSALVAAWPPIALALALEELIRMRRPVPTAAAEPAERAGTAATVPPQELPAESAEPVEQGGRAEAGSVTGEQSPGLLPAQQGVDQALSALPAQSAEPAQEVPTPRDERLSAQELVRAEPQAWTGAMLGARFGRSQRWGRMQISAVREDA